MAVIRQETLAADAHAAVAVIGAGACGLTAALAARGCGAEVVVLERALRPMGTTGMSQGFIAAAGTKAQRAAGIEDGPDVFYADIMSKTNGQTDPGMARVIADAAGPTLDWLIETHAIPLAIDAAWRGDFGHSRPRLHGVPTRQGTELLDTLVRAAERAGVDLRTGVLVTDIYASGAGRVLGVGYTRADGTRGLLGCDALVLATCGFASNAEMRRKFIPDWAEGPIWAPDSADGSGIAWGMELGAATADMGAYQGHGALNEEANLQLNYNIVMGGGIQVNALGERFCNEMANISAQGDVVRAQPGQFAWMVYDERLHLAAFSWPAHAQLQQLGLARTAPDARALAALIGLPPEPFAATIESTLRMAAGETDPFGRDFTGHPALSGPLHAVKCTGALLHTQGGLVVDGAARVLRPDGSPLPNLFAGGGTARGISGPGVWGYLPAAGLCTAVTLGRLAGEAAARQAAALPSHRADAA
jgi:fumarate reductase flavoprotein subunit